jgi:hypothetical protein
MGKGEVIKKAFLGNAAIRRIVPDTVYRDRLAASIVLARASLAAAKVKLESLPDGNKTRTAQLAVHAQLSSNVTAQETAGNVDAAAAWLLVEPMVEQAAALSAYAVRRAGEVEATIAAVDRRVEALRAQTAQMRKDRRETLNDRAAARLETLITQLEAQIGQALTTARADPDAAMPKLDDLEGTAQLLGDGTRTAIVATPEGQRKATRQTSGAVFDALDGATRGQADNRLGRLLVSADTEPDAYGFTLKDEIKSVLEVFDDHFAVATDASPDAERDNTAMRIAAMASAMAMRLVKEKDINDPLLKPVVARALVQQYGAELARSMAGKKAEGLDAQAIALEEAKARQALDLAAALLMEDPVTKLFTGKMTGPAAVESLRRQAEAAGVAPSRMLELQRQQLEMRVASMPLDAARRGEVPTDQTIKVDVSGKMIDKAGTVVSDPGQAAIEEQNFILRDLYGEVDPYDIQRLVRYREEKASVAAAGMTKTRPLMTSAADGAATGVAFIPNGKQVHQVQRGDTVSSVARDLCGPTADDATVQAKVDEIQELNRFVFWTEQVPQNEANVQAKGALKAIVPLRERRAQAKIDAYLPNKPLPVGAVLTLNASANVLDQIAGYVAAWDAPVVADAPVDADRLAREQFKESMNIRSKLSQMQERQETGQVEPKVTTGALALAASRLLPPLRPEVTNALKSLVAQIKRLDELKAEEKKGGAALSAEQAQLWTTLTSRRDELKRKLGSFRDLAATLTGKLQTQSRPEVEQSPEFKAYEDLRLELEDPAYRLAPGLGQNHGLGGNLNDPQADARTLGNAPDEIPARIQELQDTLATLGADANNTPESRELAQLQARQDQARDAARIKALTEALKPARIQTLVNALNAMAGGTDKTRTREYEALAVLLGEDAKTVDGATLMTLADRYKADLNDPTIVAARQELDAALARRDRARDAERTTGREGAMNERQYAHLKMLDRWDQDEKERFLAEKGESVETFVIRMIAKLMKIDEGAAKTALDKAFRSLERVPLTITFKAESLFSNSGKDEPAHGTTYVSDAVYTRKDVDMKALIGRDSDSGAKVAVTGGVKTDKDESGKDVDAAWAAGRGKNYMRWRTEKDDREGHLERLPFKDQQVFGAANPNWEKTRGATSEFAGKKDGPMNRGEEVPVGINYYGNAHFLLKDHVRTRIAYITRGGNSNGGGATAHQRKDFLMLFHDMILGGALNTRYLKALLTIDSDDYVGTSNAWEFHLYGGFDICNDAQEIHLAAVVDPPARGRVERFAAKYGIKVSSSKPQGVDVAHGGNAAPVEI